MKGYISIITLFILLISCQTNQNMVVVGSTTDGENTPSSLPDTQDSSEYQDTSIITKSYSRMNNTDKEILIQQMIKSMTLDEKIGQLFILAIRHTSYGDPALSMDETVSTFIDRYKPGGIILFTINFQNPEQTRKFIGDLQKSSNYPLFITTDEEGGKVSRLGSSTQMNVISLPPAAEFGKSGNLELAEDAAEVLGLDMRELGFNMNMAPVADIVPDKGFNSIGNRSYSSDPFSAGRMTAAVIKGFLKSGISPVMKHFPGHGNVGGDSHNGAVSSRSSKEEFYSRDFVPFSMGIEAGCTFIMIGHLAAPALTNSYIPASLSSEIQTGILREELGYEGIIITDAMDMGAIKNTYSSGKASLEAFLAGTDIILMPENIPEAKESIVDGLNKGLITMERLNDSIARILRVKINTGLFDIDNTSLEYTEKIKLERHQLIYNRLNSQ